MEEPKIAMPVPAVQKCKQNLKTWRTQNCNAGTGSPKRQAKLEHRRTQNRNAGTGSPKMQAKLEDMEDPKLQCRYRQSKMQAKLEHKRNQNRNAGTGSPKTQAKLEHLLELETLKSSQA